MKNTATMDLMTKNKFVEFAIRETLACASLSLITKYNRTLKFEPHEVLNGFQAYLGSHNGTDYFANIIVDTADNYTTIHIYGDNSDDETWCDSEEFKLEYLKDLDLITKNFDNVMQEFFNMPVVATLKDFHF